MYIIATSLERHRYFSDVSSIFVYMRGEWSLIIVTFQNASLLFLNVAYIMCITKLSAILPRIIIPLIACITWFLVEPHVPYRH